MEIRRLAGGHFQGNQEIVPFRGYGNDRTFFIPDASRISLPSHPLPSIFSYDPLDTTPLQLEREASPDYLTEQMTAFNLDGKGAIYHSLPFEKETEITGNVKFTVWMSMNVPDTDFQVALYEILKDGSSVYLCEDMMRARYRESLSKETLVRPGEINRYVFDTFTYFSRRIAKGSRLRLILTCPNSPRLEKNYNSGGVVAEESGKDARTAVVRVYHDAKHPSSLELPVVTDSSGSGKEKGNSISPDL